MAKELSLRFNYSLWDGQIVHNAAVHECHHQREQDSDCNRAHGISVLDRKASVHWKRNWPIFSLHFMRCCHWIRESSALSQPCARCDSQISENQDRGHQLKDQNWILFSSRLCPSRLCSKSLTNRTFEKVSSCPGAVANQLTQSAAYWGYQEDKLAERVLRSC